VAVHKFEKTTETAMTLEFNPKVAGFECRLWQLLSRRSSSVVIVYSQEQQYEDHVPAGRRLEA
jgi:hypothetical protein